MATIKAAEEAAIALLESRGFAVLTGAEANEIEVLIEMTTNEDVAFVYEGRPSTRKVYYRAPNKIATCCEYNNNRSGT